MKISDYNYNLPDDRIAKFPMVRRDRSKLLVYNRGEISADTFCNIPDYFPKGMLMVFNNTRVIRARMYFRKQTGAMIEVFLLEPYLPADYEQMFQTKGRCQWLCLVGNKKKWKQGILYNDASVSAECLGDCGTSQIIEFAWQADCNFAEIIEQCGELPIPPYLNRKTQQSDLTTYQTVYARIKGSVAAPTAGLHFTPEVLAAIDAKGIERQEVTLHVGAGTFKPVKTEDVADHEMHAEHIAVNLSFIRRLIAHDAKAIAVGTTSVRTLESLYYIGCQLLRGDTSLTVSQWEPYSTDANKVPVMDALKAIEQYLINNNLDVLNAVTQIIITPAGYEYKIVKMLVTNFHQPQSTLLLLVSAFIGNDWRKVYDYALQNNFRFLSYGDSSLLIT
ncbi:MAG: S-adenosylmethionine:tRNA ribosyltransferase-isomerase [Bacteroidaceae bacterium]|nr:S-adenosylmethionine:tRNA ribosyltransferase-isomerase [Bacteroidaceae bacterium]